jgi:hypothetical protein
MAILRFDGKSSQPDKKSRTFSCLYLPETIEWE